MQDLYVRERDRANIPEKYKWDLRDVYTDDDAWEAAKTTLLNRLPEISAFAGTLEESPEQLFRCMALIDLLRKDYTRLACYASMKSSIDTREAKYLAMEQEMSQIASDLSARGAFIEPEILRIDRERMDSFIAQDERLTSYRHIFDDILRKKAHTLSEREEKIIAEAGLMADTPGTLNSVFSNADFPYPDVTLEDESVVRLDPPAFSLNRRSANREDRKKVFETFLGKMYEFRRT